MQYTRRNLSVNRDLKITVFWHFPRTANVKSHVTSALPLGLRFEVYVLNHALSPLIDERILFHRNIISKTIS